MNTLTEHDRKLAETLRSLSQDAALVSHRPKDRRRLVLAFGVVLTGVAILAIVLWPRASAYLAPPIVPVETAPRAAPIDSAPTGRPRAAIIHEITGSGFLIVPRSTTVFSKYEGRIVQVAVEIGDRVEAGQPLVILEDAGTRFSLEQARIGEASARLALAARRITADQAHSTLRRKDALANVLSRQDVEDARTAWEQAQNDVAQAEQDLEKAALAVAVAQERTDALTVRAPIAGVVTRLGAHVGDSVLARTDSVRESLSLASIVDMNSMVIEADVAETNMAALRPGLGGEAVLDGFPDRPFPVEILRVAPSVSIEKGTVSLRLLPKMPPEGIRPGMAARIRLAIADTQRGATDQ